MVVIYKVCTSSEVKWLHLNLVKKSWLLTLFLSSWVSASNSYSFWDENWIVSRSPSYRGKGQRVVKIGGSVRTQCVSHEILVINTSLLSRNKYMYNIRCNVPVVLLSNGSCYSKIVSTCCQHVITIYGMYSLLLSSHTYSRYSIRSEWFLIVWKLTIRQWAHQLLRHKLGIFPTNIHVLHAFLVKISPENDLNTPSERAVRELSENHKISDIGPS